MSGPDVRTSFDVTVVVAGVVLGAASRVVDLAGARWVGDVAALWLLVAFLIGARVAEPRRGATSGLSCLVAASLTYYAWRTAIDGNLSNRYLMTAGVFWLLGAIVVGAAAGWAGSRSRTEPLFWGLPAGAFLGEAIAVWLLGGRPVQVALELVAAGVLMWRTRPEIRGGLRLALAVGAVIALGALLYRPVLHA